MSAEAIADWRSSLGVGVGLDIILICWRQPFRDVNLEFMNVFVLIALIGNIKSSSERQHYLYFACVRFRDSVFLTDSIRIPSVIFLGIFKGNGNHFSGRQNSQN